MNDGEPADPRLAQLEDRLALLPGFAGLRLRRNRRLMLSLRGSWRSFRISLHPGLLDHPEGLSELPAWVAARGRGGFPRLRSAIAAVFAQQRALDRDRPGAPRLPCLPWPFDLEGAFIRIHATWFCGLPRPGLALARRSPDRQRRHIRFACYRRRPPCVVVNPLLLQPWVAQAFVEHVLFHELCHHRQACTPVPGETMHSSRFRAWDREYPLFHEARLWERAHLDRFLAQRSAGSQPGAVVDPQPWA